MPERTSATWTMLVLAAVAFVFILSAGRADAATYWPISLTDTYPGTFSTGSDGKFPACVGGESNDIYFKFISLQVPWSGAQGSQMGGTSFPCIAGQLPNPSSTFGDVWYGSGHAVDGVGTYRLYAYFNSTPNACTAALGTAAAPAICDTQALYYTDFYWNGSTWSVVAPVTDTSSRIASISPKDASTTASAAVTLTVSYYANSADLYSELDLFLYDVSKAYRSVFPNGATTTITTDALTTYSTTTTLISGDTYTFGAALLASTEISGYPVALSKHSNAAQTDGVGSDGTSEFSVVINNLPSTIGATTTKDLSGLATSTCSVTNVAGCFQDAIVWAFFPSGDALNLVASAGKYVRTKAPIGYIFVTYDQLSTLNASGTPAFVLTTDWPITTYVFHPLDVALASLMGLLGILWIFRRVRHLEI